MLAPAIIDEILKKIIFPENQLHFIHPDDMEKHINELSTISAIRTSEIGLSSEGRRIYAIKIGKGKKPILAIGGAHADEPTGSVTLIHLARELAKLPYEKYLEEYTFFFIPQLDPDGAARNWRWMSEPYSYKNFTRFNYRNSDPENDVEHGIPILDGQSMRPEVEAFKSYVDKIGKVGYYITLHTTHLLGGALFVLCSRKKEDTMTIIDFLTQQCNKNGLEMMDIDLYGQSGIQRLAPGFITAPHVEDIRKFYKNHPDMLKRVKMSTYQYVMENRGAKLTLISELPFLIDPEFNDIEETEMSRYELEMENIRRYEKLMKKREELWEELKSFPYTEESKFWSEYYEFILKMGLKHVEAQKSDAGRYKEKKAKNYEVKESSLSQYSHQYSLGLMGMRRLSGLETQDAKAKYLKYEKMFEENWHEYEKHLAYWILPLTQQVKLQSTMILSGALII